MDNEIFVADEVTENVEELATEELVEGEKVEEEVAESENSIEETIEETPKAIYTEEDFNKKLDEVLAKKIARKEAKLRREYEEKYAADLELANITKQGIGEEDTETAVSKMSEFYKEKGITINPYQRESSSKEQEILARAYADEIIESGYDDIVEEVDRLAEIGFDNMSPVEKIMFNRLASERTNQEAIKYLASKGVGKELLDETEFKEFSNKYPNLSLKEKYELYEMIKPKKEVRQIGSMKNDTPNKIKDYYTIDEINRLTEDELDDPQIWEAVRKSMTSRK